MVNRRAHSSTMPEALKNPREKNCSLKLFSERKEKGAGFLEQENIAPARPGTPTEGKVKGSPGCASAEKSQKDERVSRLELVRRT